MEYLTGRIDGWLPPWALELVTSGTALAVAGVSLLFLTLALCRVVAKAGYHPALGMLLLVPGVNVIALIGLALARWPIERELKSLRHVERAVRRAETKHLRRVA